MSDKLSGIPITQIIADHKRIKRPAWLWDSEGQDLLWRNDAARLFLSRQKKHKLKLAKPAIPIKGQVRRLLRLSSIGLSSLARVRFLVGTKPVSVTCTCTPVALKDRQYGLMIVGVDTIGAKLFKNLPHPDPDPGSLFAPRADNASLNEPPIAQNETGPADKEIISSKKQLSKLVDRLANGSNLFAPLNSDEEINPKELMPPSTDNAMTNTTQWRISGRGFVADTDRTKPRAPSQIKQSSTSTPSLATEHTPPPVTPDTTSNTPPQKEQIEDINRVAKYNFDELARILGEKTRVKNSSEKSTQREKPLEEKSLEEKFSGSKRKPSAGRRHTDRSTADHSPKSTTINLSDEVLVLNRLPVGILIFRDQNILFANRAMADIVGCASISELKGNGLAAIFPKIEDQNSSLGPVLKIIGADGRDVLINARLQAISWREGSALMLSAQPKFSPEDADDISRDFMHAACEAQKRGYFELNRNGIIIKISGRGSEMLSQDRAAIINSALVKFIHPQNHGALRGFMENKAASAETRLPHISLPGVSGNLTFEIFTQGRAGIVKGYFGSIELANENQNHATAPLQKSQTVTLLLNRLSRGIRRPLNTILGFSELIKSEAFGNIKNQRYVEYARDIKTAGNEIAHLTDELDEYSRLKDQNLVLEHNDFDLCLLLDECMGLVRNQANRAQVFVRSAISEDLPFIVADRASMRQAILNLLASAIAQTPARGKVILSAQVEDDGSIGVHVRDSSNGPSGVDDRFVVFREQDERRGEAMVSMKSSIGMALTRSLVSVNSCALHVDPSAGAGTLISVVIPPELLADKS